MSTSDWQGYVMPGLVALIYAAWGLKVLWKHPAPSPQHPETQPEERR